MEIKNSEVIFKKLEEVAELSDSLSNYMPHTGYPFNQAKGCLLDVADYLNLMVDKIQECIDKNIDLKYGDRSYETVELKALKSWQHWFIENQSSYCLNDLYSVKNDKIFGKKLFETQSLQKPLPETEEEILDYLDNIITLLSNRGKMMDESFR